MIKLKRNFNLLATVATLLLVQFFSMNLSAQVINEKISKKEKRIRTVILVPSEVALTRYGFKGPQGTLKQSEEAEQRAIEGLKKVLEEKGIKVLNPFTEETLKSDDQLRYSVADLQRRYSAIQPKLDKKDKDVKKGRYTLGDEVSTLIGKHQADALVFTTATGFEPTKGRSILGWMALVPMFSHYDTRLAFVDAGDGEVLAYAKGKGIGSLSKVNNIFYKSFRKSLKKIPKQN
jgi:hypothetical protein